MSVKGPFIAGIAVAAATAIGATIVATSGGSSSAASGPHVSTGTVQLRPTTVGTKTEDVLTDDHGDPLYYFTGDTADRSRVSGPLAAAWPPVTSAKVRAAGGLTGRLTTIHDAHGNQVAYNGRLLYTFVNDGRGVARGQGVQNFFLATANLSAPAGSSSSAGSSGKAPSGGGYGGY